MPRKRQNKPLSPLSHASKNFQEWFKASPKIVRTTYASTIEKLEALPKGERKSHEPLINRLKELSERPSNQYYKDIIEKQKYFTVRASVSQERQLFEETNNPLHIWSVYIQCRSLKHPLPPDLDADFEWALQYIDDVANKLLRDLAREMDNGNTYKPEWLEYALWMRPTPGGPKQRGGGIQHFKEKQNIIHKARYIESVISILDRSEGMSIEVACQRAVEGMIRIGIFPTPKAKGEFLASVKKFTENSGITEDAAIESAARDAGLDYWQTVYGWYQQHHP